MSEPVGIFIKKAIRGKGLGMEEAAKKLGISRGTLFTKLKGADHDKEFVQLVQERLDIDFAKSASKPDSDLINYNFPIKRNRMATVLLPKDAKKVDIDIIITHLEYMKEAMD